MATAAEIAALKRSDNTQPSTPSFQTITSAILNPAVTSVEVKAKQAYMRSCWRACTTGSAK